VRPRSSLSDLPPPPSSRSVGPRVVTLGGGHGQAALLSALSQLDVSLTAVVSVADDGGCSGKLRGELGMPPPGDLRRCLASLASRRDLAARFEERLSGEEEGRCVGNLVLAEMYRDLGSLQLAVDWSAALLDCRGRVLAAADKPGVLKVYDLEWGPLSGESAIEAKSTAPLVARVEGPIVASASAKNALLEAEFIFMGPGSFIGSTLAVLTTGDLAVAVAGSPGRRVLVKNLAQEGSSSIGLDDQERVLRDHLTIMSGGETVLLDVLSHTTRGQRTSPREDGSIAFAAPLSAAPPEPASHHDPDKVAAALVGLFGFARRPAPPAPLDPGPEARAMFEAALQRARARLRSS
jgi:uncharacterized cofD-like protein